MPWLHTFLYVPSANHLVSRVVLNQAIVERNALFKILPLTFFKRKKKKNMLRLSTRWVFSFFLRGSRRCPPAVATVWNSRSFCLLPLLLCYWIHPQKLFLPVTDISSVDAVCISLMPASSFSPYLSIDGSDWSFFFSFVFLGLRWGSWNMKLFFFVVVVCF